MFGIAVCCPRPGSHLGNTAAEVADRELRGASTCRLVLRQPIMLFGVQGCQDSGYPGFRAS
eukprot:5114322-Alexandrium_andersonii.AAC.1